MKMDEQDEIQVLKGLIRDVPDFPTKGVVFKDITTLLKEGRWFSRAIELLVRACSDVEFDLIVGIEARGFAIAGPLACRLGKGLVLVRKPGKLPYKTDRVSYQLEYGTDSLEIHQGDVVPGTQLLLVDDVLATGGTSRAVADLVQRLGGVVVKCLFLIELSFLKGREKLEPLPVQSLLTYDTP